VIGVKSLCCEIGMQMKMVVGSNCVTRFRGKYLPEKKTTDIGRQTEVCEATPGASINASRRKGLCSSGRKPRRKGERMALRDRSAADVSGRG